MNIEQMKCLESNDCGYDLGTHFPGYTVGEKACGTWLSTDNQGTNVCERYLIAKIEDGNGGEELVLVNTYSYFYGGFDNYTCPTGPTFDGTELGPEEGK